MQFAAPKEKEDQALPICIHIKATQQRWHNEMENLHCWMVNYKECTNITDGIIVDFNAWRRNTPMHTYTCIPSSDRSNQTNKLPLVGSSLLRVFGLSNRGNINMSILNPSTHDVQANYRQVIYSKRCGKLHSKQHFIPLENKSSINMKHKSVDQVIFQELKRSQFGIPGWYNYLFQGHIRKQITKLYSSKEEMSQKNVQEKSDN